MSSYLLYFMNSAKGSRSISYIWCFWFVINRQIFLQEAGRLLSMSIVGAQMLD